MLKVRGGVNFFWGRGEIFLMGGGVLTQNGKYGPTRLSYRNNSKESRNSERILSVLAQFNVSFQAMDLETVVLARKNPGNAALIKHNENGLLFQTPEVLKVFSIF